MLGPDRPPGHQQRLTAGPGDRERMNDAEINAGHPLRVGCTPGGVSRDRQFRGDIDAEPGVTDRTVPGG